MQNYSWKNKRNELCKLIKKVSDQHGGDNIEWLRSYAYDVVVANKDDLDKAIECFRLLWYGYGKESLDEPKKCLKTNVCDKCGYVPPFCYAKERGECNN